MQLRDRLFEAMLPEYIKYMNDNNSLVEHGNKEIRMQEMVSALLRTIDDAIACKEKIDFSPEQIFSCAEVSFETSDISCGRDGNNETHEITMSLYTDQTHVIQVLSKKGEVLFEVGNTDSKVRFITEGHQESSSLACALDNYPRLLKVVEREDADRILAEFDRACQPNFEVF